MDYKAAYQCCLKETDREKTLKKLIKKTESSGKKPKKIKQETIFQIRKKKK